MRPHIYQRRGVAGVFAVRQIRRGGQEVPAHGDFQRLDFSLILHDEPVRVWGLRRVLDKLGADGVGQGQRGHAVVLVKPDSLKTLSVIRDKFFVLPRGL